MLVDHLGHGVFKQYHVLIKRFDLALQLDTVDQMVKRYQNLVQRANQTFNVRAYAEPNQSYRAMETEMANYLFDVYEGYSKGSYRQNKYSPNISSEELSMITGEDMRAHSLVHELTYNPQENSEGFILFSLEIDYVNS